MSEIVKLNNNYGINMSDGIDNSRPLRKGSGAGKTDEIKFMLVGGYGNV